MNRDNNRGFNELREISITPGVMPHAEGSAEVCFGNTKVFVTASIEKETPKWMTEGSGGWITAEYGMLPRSTHTRNRREASAGKQGGRTVEIQRLIGRSLRAAVDLSKLDGISIKIDCDVISADGGTRTASISGAWVALHQAITWAKSNALVPQDLELSPIAAVSLGVVKGEVLLDLCYEEDSNADFDMNLVLNGEDEIIELQGTSEKGTISEKQFLELLATGKQGISQIKQIQQKAVSNA